MKGFWVPGGGRANIMKSAFTKVEGRDASDSALTARLSFWNYGAQRNEDNK